MTAHNYLSQAREFLEQIRATQQNNIEHAGKLIADCVENDGIIHLFGGHCQMYPLELLHRQGELANVNALVVHPLMTVRGSQNFLFHFDTDIAFPSLILKDVKIGKDDIFILSSVSGRTLHAVEMAKIAKQRGAKIITIQSLEFSKLMTPKHPDGHLVSDLADVVVNTFVPYGDAIVPVEGEDLSVSAISTVLGYAALHAITASGISQLQARDIEPPIWADAQHPQAELINNTLKQRYQHRVSFL